MKYSRYEIKRLSNVELVLLEIIAETGEISGYDIAKLVKERGYRKWADIGTTSIYIGLEKLEKKGMLESFIDTKKKGKGPMPRRFKINQLGKKKLREEVSWALSNTRERDRRFDLGLAGLPFIKKDQALKSLEKRKEILKGAAQLIREKYKSDGGDGLPFHTRAVFRHPLFLIKHELEFTQIIIEGINKTIRRNGL